MAKKKKVIKLSSEEIRTPASATTDSSSVIKLKSKSVTLNPTKLHQASNKSLLTSATTDSSSVIKLKSKSVTLNPTKLHQASNKSLLTTSVSETNSLAKLKTKSVTLHPVKSQQSSYRSIGKSKWLKSTQSITSADSVIPTTGSQLLEWVRKRMSFTSEDESASSEEQVIQLEVVKEKKKKEIENLSTSSKEDKQAVVKAKHIKKGKKAKKKKKKKDKGSDEEVLHKLPRPSGMFDDIIILIKQKKEAKRIAHLTEKMLGSPSTKTLESKKKHHKKKKKRDKKPETPKKDKGVKVKPMSAEQQKEQAAAAALAAEKLRKQIEEEERKAFEAAEKRKEIEQVKRLEDLKNNLDVIKSVDEYNKKKQMLEEEDKVWQMYVECGDLPIVHHISDMSMYLQSWKDTMDQTTPQQASSRIRDVLILLDVLDDLVENKTTNTMENLENYKWLRTLFRDQLKDMMDAMTYHTLRNIDQNMNHITLSRGDFNYKDDRFTLCMWLKFQLPTPMFNPRKVVPYQISLKFEPLKLELDLPPSIDGKKMVIRVMYLSYDHLSDTSESMTKPIKPAYYSFNLADVIEREWRIQHKYKILGRYRFLYEQELQKYELNLHERGLAKPNTLIPPPPELPAPQKFKLPEVDLDGEMPKVRPTKLDPTPEEYAETHEEVEFNAMKANLAYVPKEFEINLRKYIILGGVFVMNLFYQPPQPQHLVTMKLTVATFLLPKELNEVPFYEAYSTLPPSGEQKTPEELESALRLQEEGFAKLLSLTLTLPTHVMYLEPPVVCMWEPESKLWSTRDIHDVKHNEEKGTVSFRTGKFGILGLATFRYGNLPYQAWEMKPDEDGNIVFLLTAAVLMFEFKIKGSSITVTQFQNGPNDAMQDIVAKTFSLSQLSKIFKEGGVDIFPDHDAFCYVDGTCEKHWPTEYICYYNMANLSSCYNFAWSRWNISEGHRSIVMQMRIFNPESPNPKPHSLVLVTPAMAAFINCTEVTPIFCSEPVEGSKFCCNLWYLMKATSTVYVRNKVLETSQETIYTVAQLLIKTRILSFS